MDTILFKRFELLVSLNLEGISSAAQDQELWRILKENANLKEAFIQTRNIHYFLNVLCDETASETAFVNRIKNALHPDGLSEKDFIRAVQNRLCQPAAKKRTSPLPRMLFKIAASIVILLGCAALYYKVFFHTHNPASEFFASDAIYLDWTYKPEPVKLNTSLANGYASPRTTPYLHCSADNQILKNIKHMNDQITRSEKLWP